jgi:hypothetical protein
MNCGSKQGQHINLRARNQISRKEAHNFEEQFILTDWQSVSWSRSLSCLIATNKDDECILVQPSRHGTEWYKLLYKQCSWSKPFNNFYTGKPMYIYNNMLILIHYHCHDYLVLVGNQRDPPKHGIKFYSSYFWMLKNSRSTIYLLALPLIKLLNYWRIISTFFLTFPFPFLSFDS